MVARARSRRAVPRRVALPQPAASMSSMPKRTCWCWAPTAAAGWWNACSAGSQRTCWPRFRHRCSYPTSEALPRAAVGGQRLPGMPPEIAAQVGRILEAQALGNASDRQFAVAQPRLDLQHHLAVDQRLRRLAEALAGQL
ncbi:hypothetical protein G6F62_015044 [Rhizopus arrhizus]|nr:hypothetical protein G6F62_015044 [Rhizopus arrhizus]